MPCVLSGKNSFNGNIWMDDMVNIQFLHTCSVCFLCFLALCSFNLDVIGIQESVLILLQCSYVFGKGCDHFFCSVLCFAWVTVNNIAWNLSWNGFDDNANNVLIYCLHVNV